MTRHSAAFNFGPVDEIDVGTEVIHVGFTILLISFLISAMSFSDMMFPRRVLRLLIGVSALGSR